MSLYYEKKNTLPLPQFLAGILLMTLIGMFLTSTFALIGLWLGRPYVGIFLVAVFFFIMSLLYRQMLKIAKIRNKKAARIGIFLSSLFLSYFHMNVVTSAVGTLGKLIESTNPSIYLDHLTEILITNIFSSASFANNKALFLQPSVVTASFFQSGFLWIIYFIVILFSGIIFPQFAVSITELPFNEKTGQWMTKVYSVGRLQLFVPEEKEFLREELEHGNTDFLRLRSRVTRYNADKYAKLFFYKIGEEHSGYVGVENFYHKRTPAGELSMSDYDIEVFHPAITIGPKEAARLESTLNSSAVLSFGVEDSIPDNTFKKH